MLPRTRVQNENALPDDRARSKAKPSKLSASTTSARRRPLSENAQGSVSAPPTQKPSKPLRQRSALAPLDNVPQAPKTEGKASSSDSSSTRPNVARLPRLKAPTSSTRELRAMPQRRPGSPHTPPRQVAPKTPTEQVGRAGAVRAALLNKRRPIVVPDPPPKRPRVQRSISVRADELSAGRSAVDRGYEPSPKRSAKGDAMVRSVFPSTTFEEPEGFDFTSLPPLDEPPSPPCAFGGDDFKFDLV
ncbi:hypothetical protein CC85DRAFT_283604, partial [Cutaneotrichosporon oleaginosum]